MKTEFITELLNLSLEMAQTRTLEPLLNYAMRSALDLVGAEYGYLILRQADGALEFRVNLDQQGNDIPSPETQVSKTILDEVINTKQPLVILDALDDMLFNAASSVVALQLRSVMCVPLVTFRQTLGAIYVENRSSANVFADQDVEPLTHFANQAAVFIENAILNDDLETQVQMRTAELSRANAELKEALDNIKTLKKLIPICANCKSIRNDEGFWQHLEVYFSEHADAQFSHGICPDCSKVLYPEFFKDT